MNILTKEEITQLVETDYQKALKQIEEKRVLGTFLMGPAYQTVTIFFPTIQDIAINCSPMDCWFEKTDFGGNRVIDFRLVSDLVCNNLEFIDFITNQYELELNRGSFSDVSNLGPSLDKAICNVSVCYYSAHSENEYVNLKKLKLMINKIELMVKDSNYIKSYSY